jgi:hypothetical protein
MLSCSGRLVSNRSSTFQLRCDFTTHSSGFHSLIRSYRYILMGITAIRPNSDPKVRLIAVPLHRPWPFVSRAPAHIVTVSLSNAERNRNGLLLPYRKEHMINSAVSRIPVIRPCPAVPHHRRAIADLELRHEYGLWQCRSAA